MTERNIWQYVDMNLSFIDSFLSKVISTVFLSLYQSQIFRKL